MLNWGTYVMLKFILEFSFNAINNWKLARDSAWPPAFGACVRLCSMLSRCSFEKMPHICSFLRVPPRYSATRYNTIGADGFPVLGDELHLIQPSLGPCDCGCPVNPAAAGVMGVTDSHGRNQSCLARPATHLAPRHGHEACPG